MSEIEVKVLGVNPEKLAKQLRDLGATQVKKGREINSIFDFPDGRLHDRGGYARVREFCGKSILTFKERLGDGPFKESVEHETEVASGEEAKAILVALGLALKRCDEKDRESYRLGDILYEIDHWPGYPAYLEVEAPTREAVEEGLEQIGLTLADSTGKRFHEIAVEVYGRPLPANLKF